jgi:hypothetical protein
MFNCKGRVEFSCSSITKWVFVALPPNLQESRNCWNIKKTLAARVPVSTHPNADSHEQIVGHNLSSLANEHA